MFQVFEIFIKNKELNNKCLSLQKLIPENYYFQLLNQVKFLNCRATVCSKFME